MCIPEYNHKVAGNGCEAVKGCEAVNGCDAKIGVKAENGYVSAHFGSLSWPLPLEIIISIRNLRSSEHYAPPSPQGARPRLGSSYVYSI